MVKILIFSILFLNLFGADAQLHISKSAKKKSFYEIQLASFLEFSDAKSFYSKLEDKLQNDSNIYKFSKYYAVRYGSAREKRNSLIDELKEIRESFKDAYLVKINSNTLTKRVEFKGNSKKDRSFKRESIKIDKPKRKVYKIRDNYEYSNLLVKADEFKNSNNLMKSIEVYESLLEYKDDELIETNLFYLYGKTNSWEMAKEKLSKSYNSGAFLYSYGVGAIEANSKTLEKELKPYLSSDYRGYLSLILGVFHEKRGFTYQAYEYYKSAYLKNSSDSYLTYSYARACELVELHKLAKELYENLSRDEAVPQNIRENSYIRYLELSSVF